MQYPSNSAAVIRFLNFNTASKAVRADVNDCAMNLVREHGYSKGATPDEIGRAIAVEMWRIRSIDGTPAERYTAYLRMRKSGIIVNGGRKFYRDMFLLCWTRIMKDRDLLFCVA